MQPLSTQKKLSNLSARQKSHATSWHNKNHATSRDKKITQPLGTKKSRNLLAQKKIPQALDTRKIHATSWDKISLGTKKIATSTEKKSPNLSAQKILQPLRTKKHANNQGNLGN